MRAFLKNVAHVMRDVTKEVTPAILIFVFIYLSVSNYTNF